VDKLPKHRDNLFYNTDGFVGPPNVPGNHRGSRNQTDDVMLVQHFLKIVAQNPTKFKNPFHPPKKFPAMKVDGVYGDITAHWIIAFQQHLHTIGRPVSSTASSTGCPERRQAVAEQVHLDDGDAQHHDGASHGR
jgi:hypothetical protein